MKMYVASALLMMTVAEGGYSTTLADDAALGETLQVSLTMRVKANFVQAPAGATLHLSKEALENPPSLKEYRVPSYTVGVSPILLEWKGTEASSEPEQMPSQIERHLVSVHKSNNLLPLVVADGINQTVVLDEKNGTLQFYEEAGQAVTAPRALVTFANLFERNAKAFLPVFSKKGSVPGLGSFTQAMQRRTDIEEIHCQPSKVSQTLRSPSSVEPVCWADITFTVRLTEKALRDRGQWIEGLTLKQRLQASRGA